MTENNSLRHHSGSAFISWEVPTWREAVKVSEAMRGWVFRGQQDASWGLTTSLERIAKTYGCPQTTLPNREEEILNKFKRQASHYLTHLPDDSPNGKKNLGWLSLIQHHGGPTRLLDFTRSFYVAAFFANETAETDSVVWAVNQALLDRQFVDRAGLGPEASHPPTIAGKKTDCVDRCIKRSLGPSCTREDSPDLFDNETDPILDQPNIITVKPWRLNQRMIIQQGWFLFPTSLEEPFEYNFCKAIGVPEQSLPDKTPVKTAETLKEMISDPQSNLALLRMTFPRDTHSIAMQDLQRMNITAATLFPGLDGFARSLRFPLRLFDNLNQGMQE
jgi:hypothetical protein